MQIACILVIEAPTKPAREAMQAAVKENKWNH